MTSRYTIRPFNESTWDAFAALVEANNGVFGGCWCMGFHPPDDSHADAPEPNRLRKLDRVRAGTAHAALVFDGEDCLGWCQFGAPDEVPRIKNRREYEKSLGDLPDWRIACLPARLDWKTFLIECKNTLDRTGDADRRAYAFGESAVAREHVLQALLEEHVE